MTFVPVMGQDEAPLSFDDIIGVWNVAYKDGQTATFTLSKQRNGTPKFVETSALGKVKRKTL